MEDDLPILLCYERSQSTTENYPKVFDISHQMSIAKCSWLVTSVKANFATALENIFWNSMVIEADQWFPMVGNNLWHTLISKLKWLPISKFLLSKKEARW